MSAKWDYLPGYNACDAGQWLYGVEIQLRYLTYYDGVVVVSSSFYSLHPPHYGQLCLGTFLKLL